MYGLTPERMAELFAAGQLIILAAARPLGLSMVFTPFVWGKLNSGVLRIAFSLALALPVMAPLWLVAKPTMEALPAPFVILILKEMLIGVLMGVILSLPFEAVAMAGGIIDIYRGSSSPMPGPSGEMTPFAQVFIVITLWLFAALGGYWIITELIYTSYSWWPLLNTIPALTSDGLKGLFEFLTRLVKLAIIIAGPMLALMGAVDLVFAVAAKIGKSLNVTYLSMGVKALVAVIALPPFAMVLVRVMTGEIKGLAALEPILRATIQ